MSTADEFRLLLAEVDEEVFGSGSSEICCTTSPIADLVIAGGVTIYALSKAPILEQYSEIVTDCPMPDFNFFLIQRQELEKLYYEHSAIKPRGRNWIFLQDQAINAMISKSTQIHVAHWQNTDRYVSEGGLLSARDILQITGISELSARRVELYLENKSRVFLSKHRRQTIATKIMHKSNIENTVKVAAQASALFICIQTIHGKYGSGKAFAALKRLANRSRKPK